MFNNVYRGKKVLITGHTGFKGAWMSSWLLKLGASVIGYSDKIPTVPSLFDAINLSTQIDNRVGDVRDLDAIHSLIESERPDFIFHLAAQAIVSTSYEDPINTISTNVLGTANVLEALRRVNHKCVAVIITSDKCYENIEWLWGYKETDQIGGKDIYSGSKGAAEIIFHSYFHSFFMNSESNVRLATGRAGNVIGGGDWAKDRVVADCMRSWSQGRSVEIRCPNSTRPWQHVLEPISGYLWLGASMVGNSKYSGESYNFGPRAERAQTVLDLLRDLSLVWNFDNEHDPYIVTENIPFHEAGLLKLNCDKAQFSLKWEAVLSYKECVDFVGKWYYSYYRDSESMVSLTNNQLCEYEQKAKARQIIWAN